MSEIDDLFTEAPKEVSAFNKDEWIKKKTEDRKAAFSMIEETALSMDTPEKLGVFLDVTSRFGIYSVSNLLLITAQMPDATRLADSKTWGEKKAFIKKGEKGVMIIEPGREYTKSNGSVATSFEVKKVFDISQTDAKVSPVGIKTADSRQLVKDLIKTCGIGLFRDDNLPEGINAKYDADRKIINVRAGVPADIVFADVTRELAFAKFDPSGEHREENNLKAYCVSYILCKRAGIQPAPMRGFDNPFAGKDSKSIKTELLSVRSLANDISTTLFKKKEKVRDNDAR